MLSQNVPICSIMGLNYLMVAQCCVWAQIEQSGSESTAALPVVDESVPDHVSLLQQLHVHVQPQDKLEGQFD